MLLYCYVSSCGSTYPLLTVVFAKHHYITFSAISGVRFQVCIWWFNAALLIKLLDHIMLELSTLGTVTQHVHKQYPYMKW